jgi:hypothetical protein
MIRHRWCWLCFLFVLGACDDPSDPDEQGVPEPELNILVFTSANAVPVKTASFWAVRGQNRKLEMDYADGQEFLEFEVRDRSLLRRPDGTTFQVGDSVHITVSLDPNNRIVVFFEPSGLEFNPIDPARLKINYREADRDIDGDGDEDEADRQLEAALRIWQQEQPGSLWLPTLTFRIDDDDMEARVLSFTGFAMASN